MNRKSLYRKAEPDEQVRLLPGTYEVTTTLVVPEYRVRPAKAPKGAKKKAKR